MTKFDERKTFGDGKKDTDSATSEAAPEWYAIKSVSLAHFVDRCEMLLGVPHSKHSFTLREKLYQMAHTSGRATVRWKGVNYTGPMMLDLYHSKGNPYASFETKSDWDGFCEAMRKLRNPDVPMTDRPALLRIGESIEARQRPHAEQRAWL